MTALFNVHLQFYTNRILLSPVHVLTLNDSAVSSASDGSTITSVVCPKQSDPIRSEGLWLVEQSILAVRAERRIGIRNIDTENATPSDRNGTSDIQWTLPLCSAAQCGKTERLIAETASRPRVQCSVV